MLGIVGLVIGGIWIAAADLRSKARVNETAAGILQIATAARQLLPIYTYPTTLGANISATDTLIAAGAFPASFKRDPSANVVRSPLGAVIGISQACYSASAPCGILGISWRSASDTWKPGFMTSAECLQLIRRMISLTRDRNDISHIQIQIPGNSGYQVLYPPIDPAMVDCPADYNVAEIWFRP